MPFNVAWENEHSLMLPVLHKMILEIVQDSTKTEIIHLNIHIYNNGNDNDTQYH